MACHISNMKDIIYYFPGLYTKYDRKREGNKGRGEDGQERIRKVGRKIWAFCTVKTCAAFKREERDKRWEREGRGLQPIPPPPGQPLKYA